MSQNENTVSPPSPSLADLERERMLQQYMHELTQVQSNLYELQERRDDLRSIVATLKATIKASA